MENIKFIITGGTIDSEWVPSKDTAIVKNDSGIENYINKFINPDFPISYETVSMKDSREINDDIRNKILEVIKKSSEKCFIITHGTYTMADTALFIEKSLGGDLLDKRIIVTGSFWPLEGFAPNDAAFNLGYAIGAIQNIKSGIYVAMHAKLFAPEDVIKDTNKAHFTKK